MIKYEKNIIRFLLLLGITMTPLVAQPHTIDVQASINVAAEPSVSELAIEYTHNPLNWPALHYAITQNRIDVAYLILQLYPEQATQLTPTIKVLASHLGSNASDDYDWIVGYENGISALELAVRGGHTELVAQLLDMGADINEFRIEYAGRHADFWEPRNGPWIYERCKFGNMDKWTARSLLYWAIKQENSNMVTLLLNYNVPLKPFFTTQDMNYDTWTPTINSTSALELAAGQESTEIFEQLLIYQAEGDSIDGELIALFQDFITNSENLPALHYAIYIEDIATYTLLLEHGFDIHDQGNSSRSLLQRAIESQDGRFLEILLAREELASAALTYAVSIGDIDTVRQLIEHTAATPELLKMALSAGNTDVAKAILTQPLSMEADGEALKLAIQKGYNELVELMVCKLGYSDKGALAVAIETENKEIFFTLFNRGDRDPNAIHLAIEHNQLIMVEALLAQDSPEDVEITSYMKRSIELGQEDIVSLILSFYPPSDEQLTLYKRWAIDFSQLDILLLLTDS